MIYYTNCLTPPNTTEAGYSEFDVKITKGFITRIGVFFPWGCGGLVGVKVLRNTWPIFPLTRGKWLIGNDILLDGIVNHLMDTEPYNLFVRVYNEDDTYEHTPVVIVEMVKSEKTKEMQQFFDTLG